MNEMNEIIEMLNENGYTVYTSKYRDGKFSHETTGYIHAITPRGNILYIQRSYFGGWEVALEYYPSSNNGSACICDDKQPYSIITLETIQQAEQDNYIFALKLCAKLYKSSEEWKRKHWCELIKI